MRKLIFLLGIWMCGTTLLFAEDGRHQYLSPESFKAKQRAFITEKASLTPEEAESFFPIYFELQDKKKELNDSAWKLMQKGKDENLTDAQYEEIIIGVYNFRMQSDKLDKTYYERFKKILSPKKIYMIQRAETRFHRELLKEVQRKGGERREGDGQPKKTSPPAKK